MDSSLVSPAAAIVSDRETCPLKVAVVVRSENVGGRCLEFTKGQTSIRLTRPGSSVAPKSYGPFKAVCDSGAPLFDALAVEADVEEALRSGTNYGILRSRIVRVLCF
jgi:hypothetical protein